MGDGAADGTGKGESGVESSTAERLGRGDSGGLLDDSVDLGRACLSSHCDWIWGGEGVSRGRRKECERDEWGGPSRIVVFAEGIKGR